MDPTVVYIVVGMLFIFIAYLVGQRTGRHDKFEDAMRIIDALREWLSMEKTDKCTCGANPGEPDGTLGTCEACESVKAFLKLQWSMDLYDGKEFKVE